MLRMVHCHIAAERSSAQPTVSRAIIHDVLRHRIMLSYEAQGEAVTSDQVIDELVKQIALP